MKKKHISVGEKLDAVISMDLRQEWQEMISQWERDKSKPNPYTHMEKGRYCYCPLHSVVLTFA